MQSLATHYDQTHWRFRGRSRFGMTAALVAGLAATSGTASAQTAPPLFNLPATFAEIQNIPGIGTVTRSPSCVGSDDCLTGVINLPFNFTYFGQTKTAFRISTNGWMLFTTNTGFISNDLSNDPIPSTNGAEDLIAFAWDDLINSNIRYGTIGTTVGSRIFVIESVYRGFGGSGSGRAQVWLYEADNSVELRYGNGNSLSGRSFTASIGIENSTGTVGRALSCTPTCSQTNIAALDNRILRFGDLAGVELTVTVGDFPRGAFPGGTGTGTVTLSNLGTTVATNVLTEVWLSADENLSPATDFRIGTATVANVPNGDTAAAVAFTVPNNLPAGDYRVIARVDANDSFMELIETNNTDVADQRFATAYELSGGNCRVTNPLGVNPGETLTFEVDLVNNGVPYSGGAEVRLRASTDASFDATDPVLSTVNVTFSGANTETGMGSFTLAAGALTPGRYFPICEIDPSNAIAETVETNNIVVGSTQFGSGPDLTVGAITFPQQVPPGSTQNVVTTINNVAVPFSGTVQYRLYASTDDMLDTTMDINLGLFEATFAGEASIMDTESVTFSASGIPGGRYRIIAVVDPRTRIPEVDEMNNEGVSASDFVNAIDFVGRTAQIVGATGNVQAGDTLRVRGSAESTGLAFVGNVPVGVFFSSDQTFDATDFEVFRGLIFFPGNTTGSIDVTFNIPSVPPGAYNVLVVVNPDNNPQEALLTNNAARALGTLTVQGADLRADSLVAPRVVFIGRTAEITLTINNESNTADARGFRYAYYLSENDLIRVNDRQIFVSPTATIAMGGSQTYTDQVQIPGTYTSTQSLYLGVIVDIFSAVPETSETNNITRVPVPLSVVFPIPDLVGQIVNTATSAAAGEQLAITRLISNTGVADATSFDFTYYLSNNPTISTDDLPIGTFQGSLPVNSDDYSIDVVSLPPNVTPGTYFIGLIMDPMNMVTEVSDDNNAAVGPAIPVFGPAITFITDTLPSGTIGVNYQVGIYARGGPLPITWSVSSGTLPTGLMLDSTGGILSGTPTTEGLFDFTLRASSGTAFSERDFSVRITSPTVQLAVATQTLRSAIAQRAYTADIVAVGGVPPYKWTTISGLPTGMTLTEAGRLEGTPTTPGQFPITVRVEDDLGSTATTQLVLNVVSPGSSIQIQQTPLPNAVVGESYCTDQTQVAFAAINGIEPYTWSVTGNLPMGMTFNEMGELCGTPMTAGTYDLTVRAQDSTGLFDTALFRLTVQGNDECAVATFTLPTVEVNTAYTDADGGSVSLTQVSCADPITWSVVEGSGSLPPGMTLSPEGVLSGTPTMAGAYAFSAQVTDGTNSLDVQPLSITVTPPPPPIMMPDDCTCANTSERNAPLGMLLLLPGLALVFFRRRR